MVERYQRLQAKFRQNRSKRGRDMAIFRFLKMAAAGILDFRNFNFFNRRNDQDGRTLSACQILSKSVKVRPRYSDSTIFQDGGRRHL